MINPIVNTRLEESRQYLLKKEEEVNVTILRRIFWIRTKRSLEKKREKKDNKRRTKDHLNFERLLN